MATNKQKLAAVIGATAAAGAITFTISYEGVSTTPYSDKIAGGVSTVCAGDTVAVQRKYTYAECIDMLDARMAQFAAPVRAATPGFDSLSDGQKIAAIDFTYNVGVNAYKSSSVRRLLGMKSFPAACDAFLKWKFAGGRDCSLSANSSFCGGIWRRRVAERNACMKGFV